MILRNTKPSHISSTRVKDYYEDTLRQLTGSVANKFENDQWLFQGNINFHANFGLIECSTALADADDQMQEKCISLAKCMFLDAVVGKTSIGSYRAQYNQIVKLFAFLKQNNLVAITPKSLSDFLEFSLITYIHAQKILTKSAILSSSQLMLGLSPNHWFNTLQALNVKSGFILSEAFSPTRIKSELKRALEKATNGEVAFGDWLNGGNLNSLTLDYGRYFVEHNSLIYSKYSRYSQAIRYCQNKYRDILTAAGCSGTISNYQSSINQFLANADISDIPASLRAKMSDQLFSRIRSETRKMLTNVLTKVESIEQIRFEIERGLLDEFTVSTDRQSSLDFLTRLAELYAYLEFSDIHQPILQSAEQELKLFEGCGVKLDFEALKQVVLSRLHGIVNSYEPKILDNSDYESMGLVLSDSKGATYLAEFNRMVEAAGVTVFVASTGWRESEFGFSIKDIKLEKNHDARDQIAFPVRYFTHSMVPKTAGQARELRELNSNTFRVLQQQKLITQNLLDEPALYSFQRLQTKDAGKSADMIQRSIKKNWHNFVWHYSQFKKIDERCHQHLGMILSVEHIEKNSDTWLTVRRQLLDEFNPSLVGAYELARAEYRRVNFYIRYDLRKNYVRDFIVGSLKEETRTIVQSFLSEETLQRLSETKPEDVGPLLTEEVTAEILGSCKYPTAHAFRHMWAEAVLRRFNGDLGSFIRSSFKHVSNDMWQAYISDKANIHTLKSAKREVISSILNRYIESAGNGFAGGVSKYIDRMLQSTTIAKSNQLSEVLDIINEEIIDIQASTWGFCLLKKHARHTAKCAENGEPRRYKAEPSVCMHCSNFLATEQSITSLALLAENSMQVVTEPDIPEPFQLAARKNLSKVYKQLEKLKANPQLLIKIQEVTA